MPFGEDDAPQGFHTRPPASPTLVSFGDSPELTAIARGAGAPIRRGSRSAPNGPVGLVQRRLDVLGYLGHQGGTVDGDFGPRTEAAVSAFQRAHGLPADGEVGRETLVALDREPGQTWGVQCALQELGYDLGPDGVDGILGERSVTAVKRFQEDHRLPPSGVLDEITLVGLATAIANVRPHVAPPPPTTPTTNEALLAQQVALLRNPSLGRDVHLAAVATLASLRATTELRHGIQESAGGDPRVFQALVDALVTLHDKGAITFLELQPDRWPASLRPWARSVVDAALERLRALP